MIYRLLFSATLVVICAAVTAAQITLSLKPNDAASRNDNYRLAATFGFSVSFTADQYRLYATTNIPRLRWNNSRTSLRDLFFETYTKAAGAAAPHCSQLADPRFYDPRCIDTIGLFWKRVVCTTNTIACQDNDRWNAYPGRNNISAFPTPYASSSLTPVWPRADDWGVTNFVPILNKDSVNRVQLSPPAPDCPTCPPRSGMAPQCYPSNPGGYASSASNPKVVQVKYPDGTSRWFMALNYQMHNTVKEGGGSAEDQWRIIWATSSDGQSWKVDPQILIRTVRETTSCSGGPLVTELFTDNGYFYMVLTDRARSYLLRSRIGAYSSAAGYDDGWQVASHPINPDGTYTWKEVPLGALTDFTQNGLNSYSIFPTQTGPGWTNYDSAQLVKQAVISRVFASALPNSRSRLIALTNDKAIGQPQVLQVWSTADLNRPFTYESEVDLSLVRPGQYGLEVGFTHYADNLSASPRVVGSALDIWIVQWLENPNVRNDPQTSLTVTRMTASLSGL